MQMDAAMTYSSWHHGHLRLANRTGDRRTGDRLVRNAKPWDRIVAVVTNPDLVAIVRIWALGLPVTFALFLLVPSSREIPTSIQKML
jgi:hypothetical protein